MPQRDRKKSIRPRRTVIASAVGAAVVVAAASAVMIAVPREARTPEPGVASARLVAAPRVARRETRPALDPARFSGKAAAAYQVAREIPDVLDQLTCYCACGSEYGHVSLLSCYTDGHGAT